MELISRRETQILKGIAILMVIVEHIGQAFHIGVVNPLGPIGVFLFLFLSGYGITCSYYKNGLKRYFSKKIIKVYIPYAFTIILFLLWRLSINEMPSVSSIIRYFVLAELPQGSYWYLILLFYWYFVFFLLSPLLKKWPLIMLIMLVASFLITGFEGFSRGYVWQFVSFPLGVYIGEQREAEFLKIEKAKTIKIGCILIAVGVISVVLKKMPYVEMNELGIADTALQIVLTLSLGSWLILNRAFFTEIKLFIQVFYLVGAVSYELYLSHVIALDWLKEDATVSKLLLYFIVTFAGMIIINILNRRIARLGSNIHISGGNI